MKTKRWLLASLIVAALGGTAVARSEKTLAYERDQCWPTAVRFLRVDEGLALIEKDAEAGYVLFELKEEGKTFRGSLEVMTVRIDGRTVVRFILQIEDRPSWLEVAMLTRLERKLRSELGAPAPPPSKPKDRDKGGDKGDKVRDEPPKSSEPAKPDDHGPPVSPTP